MKKLFLDTNGKLRNGWWILIFIGCVAVTRFVYRPVTHGLRDLGLPNLWLEMAPFLFALLATWACTRMRRESLASVGFRLKARWFGEIVAGTVLGIITLLVVVGMVMAIGGVRFDLDPMRSGATLLRGFYIFLCAALLEETFFRGFMFQRLLDGIGVGPAQIAMAALFVVAHWGNPGMEGGTQVVAALDLFLGSLMLGLAYLRTRSLALPVGLHLGWNWMQGYVFGFGVSGYGYAGWFMPVFGGKAEWLTGGNFGPESSVFSPLVSLVMIVLLWRWKGSVRARAPA